MKFYGANLNAKTVFSLLTLELLIRLELNDTYSESVGDAEACIVFDKAFATGFQINSRSSMPGDNVTADAVGTYIKHIKCAYLLFGKVTWASLYKGNTLHLFIHILIYYTAACYIVALLCGIWLSAK